MADILRQLSTPAATANAALTARIRIIIMALESPNMIDRLTAQNKYFFWAYLAFAVLTAAAGWFVWRSGNKVQDAIRADAEAKIATANASGEQAKRDAAVADEKAGKAYQSAGEANERAEQLEKEAAEARTRQAEAEAEVLRLKQLTRARALSLDQLTELQDKLRAVPDKIPVEIITARHKYPTTLPSELFARQLTGVLITGGWTKDAVIWRTTAEGSGPVPETGISIRVTTRQKEGWQPHGRLPPILQPFFLALGSIKLHSGYLPSQVNPSQPTQYLITIIVGLKPVVY